MSSRSYSLEIPNFKSLSSLEEFQEWCDGIKYKGMTLSPHVKVIQTDKYITLESPCESLCAKFAAFVAAYLKQSVLSERLVQEGIQIIRKGTWQRFPPENFERKYYTHTHTHKWINDMQTYTQRETNDTDTHTHTQ
eukprot:GHVR01042319.1.p1 GENE.GHVR01042319.1~~GHVR01042319.1.p1  ORF type:complete len:136 (+),score=48.22 GHVR01042319.1:91-498(+)